MIDLRLSAALAALLFLFLALRLLAAWRGAASIRLEVKSLMTAAERRALALLEDALPGFRIHAQVAMGALLRPERGLSRRKHWHWRGRYAHKIVNFTVEDRASGRVIALVELDDRSHDAARDAKREALARAAEYQTVRLRAPSQSRIIAAFRSLPLIADVPT